jgi:hypothetical protein
MPYGPCGSAADFMTRYLGQVMLSERQFMSFVIRHPCCREPHLKLTEKVGRSAQSRASPEREHPIRPF